MKIGHLHELLAVVLTVTACVGGSSTSDASSDSQGSESGAGDSGDGDGDLSCTPDLEALRTDIFAPSCALAGCHNSADAAAGLDLETSDLESELVGAPSGTCDGWVRVVPGVPDESLLYLKIAGPAPCGSLMPPPAGLPAEQVACVRSWIEDLQGMTCETCGGDACIDLQTDAQNCGECGNACPDGIACDAGTCVCPGDQQLCNGSCVDVQADPQHCGDCSTACMPSQVCSQGACADGCGNLSDCGGACVDLDSDPNNCGSCGNACGQGNSCDLGTCGCPDTGVAFAADVEPMLTGSCTSAGCHGFPAPAEGLDLRSGAAYNSLVGVASAQCNNRLLVAPGQPGASYLLDKLQGVNICFGSQMPKAAPPFSAEQLAMISEWICNGAMDN